VEQFIEPTGEIFDEVQLDGIYLQHGHCCSIAYANGCVVDFQWCTTENATAWGVLLARIPAPAVAVIDGGAGLAKALKTEWPETMVQRCLVHIQRNVRRHLTRRPRTTPGRHLAKLNYALTKIHTLDEAAEWMTGLATWHSQHRAFLHQKTYATDPMATTPWWWTHDRVRKAYNLLATQARKGTLFQYLQPELLNQVTGPVSSTTNRIEGGVNAPLRQMLFPTAACAYRAVNARWNGGYSNTPKPQPPCTRSSSHTTTARHNARNPSSKNPSARHSMIAPSQPKKASASNTDGKDSDPRHAGARHTFLPITRSRCPGGLE
jgi:hypothetical protein